MEDLLAGGSGPATSLQTGAKRGLEDEELLGQMVGAGVAAASPSGPAGSSPSTPTTPRSERQPAQPSDCGAKGAADSRSARPELLRGARGEGAGLARTGKGSVTKERCRQVLHATATNAMVGERDWEIL